MVCLDTSTIIEVLCDNKMVVDAIMGHSAGERISTTAITEYELLKYAGKKRVDAMRRLLETMVVHGFDRAAAMESSAIFGRLEAKGTPIDDSDIMIAGVAASRGELLITMDKDFSKLGSDMVLVLEK